MCDANLSPQYTVDFVKSALDHNRIDSDFCFFVVTDRLPDMSRFCLYLDRKADTCLPLVGYCDGR